MENRKTQELAEKIARLLQENETGSGDARFFRESLENINRRLENIESQISFQNPKSQIPNSKSNHPSQERFLIAAIADEIIENLKNEKACPYEPTGKPCDNCAMCSSRGF